MCCVVRRDMIKYLCLIAANILNKQKKDGKKKLNSPSNLNYKLKSYKKYKTFYFRGFGKEKKK